MEKKKQKKKKKKKARKTERKKERERKRLRSMDIGIFLHRETVAYRENGRVFSFHNTSLPSIWKYAYIMTSFKL